MSTIFHVAFLVMCFNGDCIRFESVPYSHNISHEQCMKMLEYTFKTQVGPYYDEVIDFEQSVPADLIIAKSGCDVIKSTGTAILKKGIKMLLHYLHKMVLKR